MLESNEDKRVRQLEKELKAKEERELKVKKMMVEKTKKDNSLNSILKNRMYKAFLNKLNSLIEIEGSRDTLNHWLKKHEKEIPFIAYITLSHVLQHVGSTRNNTVFTLTNQLNKELVLYRSKRVNTFWYDYLIKNVKHDNKRTDKKVRRYLEHHKENLITPEEYPEEFFDDKLTIKLFYRLIETGFFQVVSTGWISRKRFSSYKILLSPVAEKFTKDVAQFLKESKVQYKPLLVRRDRVSLKEGGMLSEDIELVKWRYSQHKNIMEIEERKNNLQLVYDSINKLESTGFKINKKVFNVIDSLKDKDIVIGDMDFYNVPVEFKPKQIQDFEEYKRRVREKDPIALKQHEDFMMALSARTSRQSKGLMTRYIYNIAKEFLDEEEFFYTYTLDWRGRIYALQSYLNPQGVDISKGLLLFSKPTTEPLEGESLKWFKINLANKYGLDKKSFENRIKWVDDNKDLILAVAKDPLRNLSLWSDTDKPFQFLAGCFEYAEFLADPVNFRSYLPLHMDGTCNGLQHFAALLRDKQAGYGVGMNPKATKPSDIYTEVRDEVERLNIKNLKSKDQQTRYLAKQWQQLGITRKAVKRNVMTLSYGVTFLGMRAQIEDYLKDVLNHSIDKRINELAIYLAKLVFEVISVKTSALVGMKYLQEAAKHNPEIVWTLPDGFKVYQHYQSYDSEPVIARVDNKVITLRKRIYGKPSKIRQKNAISPNFVHSLDAAHLRSVVRALDSKIPIATIHDSFATNAQYAGELAKTIREEFIKLYSFNWLEYWRDINDINPKIKIPVKGDLDLQDVLKAPYFFH